MRLAFAMTATIVTGSCHHGRVRLCDEQLPDLPVRGAPQPGGMSLQTPATPDRIGRGFLDNLLLWIIVPIVLVSRC